MTRIAIVRHGHFLTKELSPGGVVALEKLAATLGPEFNSISRIFTSPTERTRLTAEFLANKLSLPSPVTEEELGENSGDFTALKIIAADSKTPLIFVTHAPTSRILPFRLLGLKGETPPLSLGEAVILDTVDKFIKPVTF